MIKAPIASPAIPKLITVLDDYNELTSNDLHHAISESESPYIEPIFHDQSRRATNTPTSAFEEEEEDWSDWEPNHTQIPALTHTVNNDNDTREELAAFMASDHDGIASPSRTVSPCCAPEDDESISTATHTNGKSFIDMMSAFFQAIIQAISSLLAAITRTSLGFFKTPAMRQNYAQQDLADNNSLACAMP